MHWEWDCFAGRGENYSSLSIYLIWVLFGGAGLDKWAEFMSWRDRDMREIRRKSLELMPQAGLFSAAPPQKLGL